MTSNTSPIPEAGFGMNETVLSTGDLTLLLYAGMACIAIAVFLAFVPPLVTWILDAPDSQDTERTSPERLVRWHTGDRTEVRR